MPLEFTRTNEAILDIIEYYEIKAIKLHLFKYAGTERCYSTPHLVDMYKDYSAACIRRLDDEINQIILTHNLEAKVLYFELLKDWLTDWRIVRLNKELIIQEVDKYNDKTYADFVIETDEKVKKFQQNPYFHLGNKVEYEVERKGLVSLFGFSHSLPYKTKEINYIYYCNDVVPELIDIDFIQPYYEVVNAVIRNFRAVVEKYVRLYNEGHFISLPQITIEKKLLENSNKKLHLNLPSIGNKLKVNLSVKELTFLFRILKEKELIQAETLTEIYRFIAANFITKAKDDISEDSIKNNYNTIDPKTAAMWTEHFRSWVSDAKKIGENLS